MDWIQPYSDDLYLVFRECGHLISGFPPPLNTVGLAYLDKFNVFQAESHKNYICYLLPFWLREGYGLTPEDSRTMAMGNIFCMLYFFIQDDLMDTPESSPRESLPLANLLYMEFLNCYRNIFSGRSSFWQFYNRYITQWADSVSNEKTTNYYQDNPVKIAHRASPLKLSSTAALLLSGHEPAVSEVEEAIDLVLLTLQMLDDYEDWEEDLASGSYNCLLSLIRSRHPVPGSPLTEDAVRAFIFDTGGLQEYASTALAHHNRLQNCSILSPPLISFHHTLVMNLQEISMAIESDRTLLLDGALSYFLSKNNR